MKEGGGKYPENWKEPNLKETRKEISGAHSLAHI